MQASDFFPSFFFLKPSPDSVAEKQQSHAEHARLNLIQVRLTRLVWAQKTCGPTQMNTPCHKRMQTDTQTCATVGGVWVAPHIKQSAHVFKEAKGIQVHKQS